MKIEALEKLAHEPQNYKEKCDDMEKRLLEALEAYYTGNIKKAEANIYVYMKQPVGIGEHPQILEEMD